MLDIGWWELMVVGMVALVVVGPKELPTLLRTIGRYVGMAKRQADEFRSQFDDAMRDSEFNDLRNEMNEIQSGVTSSLNEAQQSIDNKLDEDDFKDPGAEFDYDEEPIEPAPEFADDKSTDSFTTSDGETISKQSETSTDEATASSGDAAKSTPSVDDAANDTAPELPETKVASTRDAEAVR